MDLPRLIPTRRTGGEQFHRSGRALELKLLDFWQWHSSDLVSNATRGRLAEFIVAAALGIDTQRVRDEWAWYDLDSPDGVKIEVKSSAYVQSWPQRRLSSVSFSVKPTRPWEDTGLQAKETRRQADVYVFALLHHQDKATVDPLDINQWCFYVLPSRELDARPGNPATIRLKELKSMTRIDGLRFEELREAVSKAAEGCRTP